MAIHSTKTTGMKVFPSAASLSFPAGAINDDMTVMSGKRHLWDPVDPFYGWQGKRSAQRAGLMMNTMNFYPGSGR